MRVLNCPACHNVSFSANPEALCCYCGHKFQQNEGTPLTQRFNLGQENEYGQVTVFDLENTEPVCLIFARFHPYAPKLILGALSRAFPQIRPEVRRLLGLEEER